MLFSCRVDKLFKKAQKAICRADAASNERSDDADRLYKKAQKADGLYHDAFMKADRLYHEALMQKTVSDDNKARAIASLSTEVNSDDDDTRAREAGLLASVMSFFEVGAAACAEISTLEDSTPTLPAPCQPFSSQNHIAEDALSTDVDARALAGEADALHRTAEDPEFGKRPSGNITLEGDGGGFEDSKDQTRPDWTATNTVTEAVKSGSEKNRVLSKTEQHLAQ